MSENPTPEVFRKGETFFEKGKKYFHEQKFTKSRQFLELALEKYHLANAIFKEAEVLDFLGQIDEIHINFSDAKENFTRALELRNNHQNLIMKGNSFQNLSRIDLRLNNLEEALDSGLKAYDLYERAGIDSKNAEITFLLGQIYEQKSDLPSAKFYYSLAKDFLKSHKQPHLEAFVYENLASIYFQLGNLVEAEKYFKIVLNIEHQFQNPPIIIKILTFLFHIYFEMDEIDKARKIYSDLIELYRTIKTTLPISTQITQQLEIAKMQLDLGEFAKAELFCEHCIELIEINGQEMYLAKALNLMAEILLATQIVTFTNHKDEITQYLAEAMERAQKDQNTNQLVQALILKYRLAEVNNDHKTALEYLNEAEKIGLQSGTNRDLAKIYEYYALQSYKDTDISEAYEYFTHAIEFYEKASYFQKHAELKYNLACIAARQHIPEDVIKNLKESINLNPKFKHIAAKDEDFRGLFNNSLFRNLIDEKE